MPIDFSFLNKIYYYGHGLLHGTVPHLQAVGAARNVCGHPSICKVVFSLYFCYCLYSSLPWFNETFFSFSKLLKLGQSDY